MSYINPAQRGWKRKGGETEGRTERGGEWRGEEKGAPAASTLASVFPALIAALITLISCLPATQQPETGRLSSQKVLGDEFPGSPREGEAVLTGGPWGRGLGAEGAGGGWWKRLGSRKCRRPASSSSKRPSPLPQKPWSQLLGLTFSDIQPGSPALPLSPLPLRPMQHDQQSDFPGPSSQFCRVIWPS